MPQDWWCIAPLFNLKNAKKEGEILLVGGVNSVLFAVAFLRMRHIGKKKKNTYFLIFFVYLCRERSIRNHELGWMDKQTLWWLSVLR